MRIGKSSAWLELAGLVALATAAGAATGWSAGGGTDLKRGAVTFNHDVAPIIFSQCASCHRPGEVAPFSLLSYEDVKRRARQIALVTEQRVMPPWKADSHGEFKNERRLTAEQIRTVRLWADTGTLEGDSAERPSPPMFHSDWQLGEPDAVFEPDQSFDVPADGPDLYLCFVLPTKYAADRYVSAVEVRPGNRSVVHHVLVFLDTSGTARKLDAADPGPGYNSFGGVGFVPAGGLGGWAPGNLPPALPEGVGHLLPKGADIVLQVHYHESGKAEQDRTRIGVHFCKGPVTKRVRHFLLAYPFLNIRPGDPNYKTHAQITVPANVTLLDVTPHMHLLGKEMTVSATVPDGSPKQIVSVPDWDFNWQTTYTFKEPLKLRTGTKIGLDARCDNSDKNPRNPNHPPKRVTWGEQTTDEMCIAFLGYTLDGETLAK